MTRRYNAVMSAHLMVSVHRCCQRSVVGLVVARRPWSWSPVSSRAPPPPPPPPLPPPLGKRLLLYLTERFYDVEMLLSLGAWFTKRNVKKKNCYFSYTKNLYGIDIAAAYFVLNLKGGFRYVGQSAWFRADSRGKFNWAFLNHKNTKLEEVDMSYSLVNDMGLMNLEEQKSLRTLRVRGCPEVDDWFLAKLHIFQDSLEELDISGCPRITTGGLAALRHVKGLRRLDISSLPGINSPGLIIILLEEMLPLCEITATGYDLSFSQTEEKERVQGQRRGGHSPIT